MDAKGRAAAFTGQGCFAWAGHKTGKNYTCQGNILAGEAVVQGMAAAFEKAKGALAERLVAALAAGQKAGGDHGTDQIPFTAGAGGHQCGDLQS